MSYPEYMEQDVCAKCGSGNTLLERIEFHTSVLLWYRCFDCECLFIEAYEYASKGIVGDEEE